MTQPLSPVQLYLSLEQKLALKQERYPVRELAQDFRNLMAAARLLIQENDRLRATTARAIQNSEDSTVQVFIKDMEIFDLTQKLNQKD